MNNGEWKIIWGCTMIVVTYAIYMTCHPNPGDGAILAGVVGAISAMVAGIAAKSYVQYRTLVPKERK